MRSRLLSCVSSWRCVVRICWCHSHHIRAHIIPIIVLTFVATHKCVGTKKDEQEEELIGMHEPVWWDGALPTVHTPAYVDGQMVWWLTYHRVRLGSYNRQFRRHSFLMNGLSQKCKILTISLAHTNSKRVNTAGENCLLFEPEQDTIGYTEVQIGEDVLPSEAGSASTCETGTLWS